MTETTSIFDEAAFGHEGAKALARSYADRDEWYKTGWNNALEDAAKNFGPEAVDQVGYNIAEELRKWKKQ